MSQCSREPLIFDEPITLAGTAGELVLTIDGNPRRWKIRLPESATPSRFVRATVKAENS